VVFQASDVAIDSIHVLEDGTFLVVPRRPITGCRDGELTGLVGKSKKVLSHNAWKAALSLLPSVITLGKQVDIPYDSESTLASRNDTATRVARAAAGLTGERFAAASPKSR
jgi:hypothetical protein